jgi:hypothetical protein
MLMTDTIVTFTDSMDSALWTIRFEKPGGLPVKFFLNLDNRRDGQEVGPLIDDFIEQLEKAKVAWEEDD